MGVELPENWACGNLAALSLPTTTPVVMAKEEHFRGRQDPARTSVF